MSIPLVLGICEDELERDSAFLKAFAGPKTDIRLAPTIGGGPSRKEARILKRQYDAAKKGGFQVRAFLLHRDADRTGLKKRRDEIDAWFKSGKLDRLGLFLIRCVPHPCTEAWLCSVFSIRAKDADPAAGCKPWETAWERSKGHDLDQVREAAVRARKELKTRDDFGLFMEDWNRAGLE